MFRIFTLLLVLLPMVVSSQHLDKISFQSQDHDFGKIYESDGPVNHEFRFVNISEDSLKITGVQASCGCTTPSWSSDVLAPGDSGYVQAQYNPLNRPGRFNKNLKVQFDGIEQPVTLLIRGSVIPRAGSVEEEFRNEIGGIRLRYSTFNMGKVFTTDESTEKRFEVYNGSDTVITFQENIEHPPHVSVSFDPPSVEPGKIAEMVVLYDAKNKGDLGFSSDNITFYTDEPEGAQRKSVNLYATIEEYFPPMTAEEMKVAPHLKIDEPLHDFDKISQGERVTTEFRIVNSGQSQLEIRQLKGNCACITASIDKMKLQPGESAEIKVTFDSTQRKGNQQKSITVYSNDPTAPAQRMTIRARVDD